MKYLEEDFERLSTIEQMYLIEAHERMIEEWCEWEDYQKRKPAEIELVKIKKHEKYNKGVYKSITTK